jgi:hypothetical protein
VLQNAVDFGNYAEEAAFHLPLFSVSNVDIADAYLTPEEHVGLWADYETESESETDTEAETDCDSDCKSLN